MDFQDMIERLAAAFEEGRRAGLEEVKLLLSARVTDLVWQRENEGLIDGYAQGLHDEAEGLLSEVTALAQTSTKGEE